MNAKLTLRLNDSLIKQAKAYASSTGRSVSQLVADYFALLGTDERQEEGRATPEVVVSLHGLLAGTDADESEYARYLEEKHGVVGQ
jgi:hypothetical protein